MEMTLGHLVFALISFSGLLKDWRNTEETGGKPSEELTWAHSELPFRRGRVLSCLCPIKEMILDRRITRCKCLAKSIAYIQLWK